MTQKKEDSDKKKRKKKPEQIAAAKRIVSLMVNEFKKDNQIVDLERLDVNKGLNQNLNIENKEMGQIQLHPNLKSVICATVFGDSSIAIHKGYSNARIQYRHSTRQREWFLWKTFNVFGKFITDNSIQFQLPDGYQAKTKPLPGEILGKLKVVTAVNPTFTQLMPILAPNNKKKMSRSWLNHMTSWFLVTLWIDDGSLTSGGRQGVICVNGGTTEDANILAEYITVVWGAKCKVANYKSRESETNPDSPKIEFVDLDNLEIFLRIVAPLIPIKSMLYKVCLCPLDNIRRQRWTSELKQLVRPDWHDKIDEIYASRDINPQNNLD